MPRIAHLVNPVKVSEKSDLFLAQPVTFETMRRAKAFAAPQVTVELFTAQYLEDHSILPENFTVLPDLERSVLDLGDFDSKRKLPILRDMLNKLYNASQAEYFIYTNVDIALMPHFYLAVDKMLEQYDALIINRRTIPKFENISQLPLMYAEAGKKHPGYDCFVFSRKAYERFELGDVCIGAVLMDILFYANVLGFSERFHEAKDADMTFHIGDDRTWDNPANRPYLLHNADQLEAAVLKLHEKLKPFDETTAIGRYFLHKYRLDNINRLRHVLSLDNPPNKLKKPNKWIPRSLRRIVRKALRAKN
jgi:hypothetical protein